MFESSQAALYQEAIKVLTIKSIFCCTSHYVIVNVYYLVEPCCSQDSNFLIMTKILGGEGCTQVEVDGIMVCTEVDEKITLQCKYRGVGNIRTLLKTFSRLFVDEIFVGNIRTDFFLCRLYFPAFPTFDLCCRQHFDCLYFDYLSGFSASEA